VLSLLYLSSASVSLSEMDLVDILRVSRSNNARLDVTGLLLYQGRSFIQVLEGPDDAVTAVYTQIGRDPRHYAIQTVLRQSIQERDFPQWSMGFQHIDVLPADALPGFSAFLREPVTATRLHHDPRTTYSFLRAFRKNMG
jgi:Sensors of blue-light using FAD